MNYDSKIRKRKLALLFLAALLLLSIVLATAIGPVKIPKMTILEIVASRIPLLDLEARSASKAFETIIIDVRMPRVMLGVLVGAASAVSGATLQGLFKNPMADPAVIGISSGAALGATAAIVLGVSFGIFTIPVFAFFGAAGAVFLVFNIARVGGKVPVDTLLLSGIAVATFLSAITSFLMYISGEDLHQIVYWLMGGLWTRSWQHVAAVCIPISLGTAGIYVFSRDMNVMLLGEEASRHLGISVENVKRILLVLVALVAGTAVAVSGIIGFVGLIIPHIVRILLGPDHRILIPASALCGAIFLIWADTIARTVASPAEIPVGIITAIFGAPFFLYLLRKRRKSVQPGCGG